jgi:hypothetical protein
MNEDLPATLKLLEQYFNVFETVSTKVSLGLIGNKNKLVICDISPLGINAAKKAGIPAVLIENFTWDWIYESYVESFPEFEPFNRKFKHLFAEANYHIKAEPVSDPMPDCDLKCSPISRLARQSKAEIRQCLNITEGKKVVLVTMGGIPTRFQFLEQLSAFEEAIFIIPGSSDTVLQQGNLRLLPHHSGFYHPDLVSAADAVIAKAGYSTIAEAFHAGIPFGYLLRQNFRESTPLGKYIHDVMNGIEFTETDFETGGWQEKISALLGKAKINHPIKNGADQVADFIFGIN